MDYRKVITIEPGKRRRGTAPEEFARSLAAASPDEPRALPAPA
jgi:hypothetical protein